VLPSERRVPGFNLGLRNQVLQLSFWILLICLAMVLMVSGDYAQSVLEDVLIMLLFGLSLQWMMALVWVGELWSCGLFRIGCLRSGPESCPLAFQCPVGYPLWRNCFRFGSQLHGALVKQKLRCLSGHAFFGFCPSGLGQCQSVGEFDWWRQWPDWTHISSGDA
jgi:hypothetical protein